MGGGAKNPQDGEKPSPASRSTKSKSLFCWKKQITKNAERSKKGAPWKIGQGMAKGETSGTE